MIHDAKDDYNDMPSKITLLGIAMVYYVRNDGVVRAVSPLQGDDTSAGI